MSKYSTTIHNILQSFIYDEIPCDLSVNEIINKTVDKFFDFNFEWYSKNGEGLKEFKRDFLLTYYNSYIGCETLGMFKTYLNAQLNVDMPYYKKLYEALQEGDNPFINYDVKYESLRQDTHTENVNSNSQSNMTTDYQSIDSDNPQITVGTEDYASSMTRGQNVGVSKTTGKGDSLKEGAEHENKHDYGLRGKSKAEVISEYQSQIVNINKDIIKSCKFLFLGTW